MKSTARTFEDDLGQGWEVSLERVEDPTDVADEEVVIHFVPADGDADEREIRARGPLEERFGELDDRDIELAWEAAGNEAGFLFLPTEGHLWWVRSGDEDPVADGARITFSDLTDEHAYAGPHGGRLDNLSEDELQEILDELRGLARP